VLSNFASTLPKPHEQTLKTKHCQRACKIVLIFWYNSENENKLLDFADPHLAHCLLPDTRAKTSQKSKSQTFRPPLTFSFAF